MLWAESGGDAILPPRSAKLLPSTLPLSRAAKDTEGTGTIRDHIGAFRPTALLASHARPAVLCAQQRDTALRHFSATWVPELDTDVPVIAWALPRMVNCQ